MMNKENKTQLFNKSAVRQGGLGHIGLGKKVCAHLSAVLLRGTAVSLAAQVCVPCMRFSTRRTNLAIRSIKCAWALARRVPGHTAACTLRDITLALRCGLCDALSAKLLSVCSEPSPSPYVAPFAYLQKTSLHCNYCNSQVPRDTFQLHIAECALNNQVYLFPKTA